MEPFAPDRDDEDEQDHVSDPTEPPETGDVPDTIEEDDRPAASAETAAESATAASEQEDETPVEAGEAEPAAPTVEPGTRAFEQAEKRLDRAVANYRKQVDAFVEATGQSLIPNQTDLAFAPGYIFHPQVRPLDDEQEAFARALLGMALEPAFKQDPESNECSDCEGWGRVKTGSKVAGNAVVNCHRCNGHGFISSRPMSELQAVAPHSNGGEPMAVLTEAEQADDDAWGTPRSHADWGKSPQYRSPNWQAELAAYKQGQPAPVPAL